MSKTNVTCRAQEIEGDLKKCSDQFKMFERQDLKYQEDLKHLKQKLKKVEEKILKVIFLLRQHEYLSIISLKVASSR